VVSFRQVSPPESCICLSSPPFALHALPISFTWTMYLNSKQFWRWCNTFNICVWSLKRKEVTAGNWRNCIMNSCMIWTLQQILFRISNQWEWNGQGVWLEGGEETCLQNFGEGTWRKGT
jgi:hypothetical protein